MNCRSILLSLFPRSSLYFVTFLHSCLFSQSLLLLMILIILHNLSDILIRVLYMSIRNSKGVTCKRKIIWSHILWLYIYIYFTTFAWYKFKTRNLFENCVHFLHIHLDCFCYLWSKQLSTKTASYKLYFS